MSTVPTIELQEVIEQFKPDVAFAKDGLNIAERQLEDDVERLKLVIENRKQQVIVRRKRYEALREIMVMLERPQDDMR